MYKYIDRLRRMGFKSHIALRICEFFIHYFDKEHLEKYINELEAEEYVAKI